MHRSLVRTSLIDLRDAVAAERAANAEAIQRGMAATQPLTAVRLGELCALGEEMLRTGRRRKVALARLRMTIQLRDAPDARLAPQWRQSVQQGQFNRLGTT